MDVERLSALAERVLGGETEAYEAIFLETKDNLYFHAKTILLSEEAAWDAVQDSYLAAFRSLEKLANSGRLMMWLCAIVSNISFSRLRKQPRANTAAKEAASAEITENTLAALPDMQRTALLLRYCDDMAMAQIASVMRCSEMAAQNSLADAEKALGLVREFSSDMTALSPSELKTQMERLELKCQLPPSLTLSIGSIIAQKCGYSSSLRVTSGVSSFAAPRPVDRQRGTGAMPRPKREREQEYGRGRERDSERERAQERSREREQEREYERRRGDERKYERDDAHYEERREARERREPEPPPINRYGDSPYQKQKKKSGGMPIAAAVILVISGLILGVFAVRYISAHFGGGKDADVSIVNVRRDADSAPREHQALSSEAAQAYLGVLTGHTGKSGVCSSTTEGPGLAYANLIDFDADGYDELYLYYIDREFSAENAQYSRGDDGTELWCLHEELWRYDGELKKCYEAEHFHTGAPSSANTEGRWLLDNNGRAQLASWHSDVDENGYINQYLTVYELAEGTLEAGYEVTATFVVANQAKYMAEGYAIENYYGTDNAQFDSIAYFFEGAVKADGHRVGYSYTDCLALADLSTSDIVPLDDYNDDNPVTLLKDFYDARRDGGRQLIYFNGAGLTWELSDINNMLSSLADICTGKAETA